MAVDSREIVWQKPHSTIGHVQPLMAMFLGLDNREVLPPFLPFSRNEDGMFARILSLCRDAYAVHLPFTLEHTPFEVRTYPDNGAAVTRICDIITAALASFPDTPTHQPESERLAAAGKHLVEIARLAPFDFAEFVRIALMSHKVANIRRLESLIGKPQCAAERFWVEDLRRQIEAIEVRLVSRDFIVPLDVDESTSEPGTICETQALVREYGEMLGCWSAMIEAARSCGGAQLENVA